MPNPFNFPTICTLPKYAKKRDEISLEKIMFIDYPYLLWAFEKLTFYGERGQLGTLLDLGEKLIITGKCRVNGCNNLAKKICFYRGSDVTSRGRTMNANFQGRCLNHTHEYEQRGSQKHRSTDIVFSSIQLFDTVCDRKEFVKELKYCIGLPSRLSNEAVARYFYDLYEQVGE